jgi:hypothetical protein
MGDDRPPFHPSAVSEDDYLVMLELALLCDEITTFGFDYIAGATTVDDHFRMAERLYGVADAVVCVTGESAPDADEIASSEDHNEFESAEVDTAEVASDEDDVKEDVRDIDRAVARPIAE